MSGETEDACTNKRVGTTPFFGPRAVVTPEEEQFFSYWTAGRRHALDLGAGLCGPATMLARLGLEVLAFEPSPIVASLAVDRLNQGDEIARSVTLVEGPIEAFAEPYAAEFILVRSVLMLLSDTERSAVLEAARRHAAAQATLIVDVRTAALPWTDKGRAPEERRLGHLVLRRHTDYTREPDGGTRVQWRVQAERFGRIYDVATESFRIRPDNPDGLRELLHLHGFETKQFYGGYDIDRPYTDGSPMIMREASVRSLLSPVCDELTVRPLADCGHYPMQECPPLTYSYIEQFLS